MKRLLRIFELSKNEQRVVLIICFVLIAIAFVGYERRVHRSAVSASISNGTETISECCGNGRPINSLIALVGPEFGRSRQRPD